MECLGCGPTSSTPSREHVFPRWLLTEFDPDISMALYRRLEDGSREQRRDEIRLDSFTLKRVCESCNNGWMSQLEERAKPIILGVIRNEREPSSLSELDRRVVAKWAAKTAVVESHSVGAESPVSGAYLQRMRTAPDDAPGRFAVAACRTEMRGFGHMQVGIIRDLVGGDKICGSITIIALPTLVFACAFPMLDVPYECRLVSSLYTPLWPPAAA